MADAIDPSFEYDRGPVLAGAAVFVLAGTVSLFGFGRPAWLLPSAIVAGGVAGYRSSFYAESATNGLVAAGAGMVLLLPLLVAFRAEWLSAFGAAGSGRNEWLFLGGVGALADVIVIGPLVLLGGYVGAAAASVIETSPNASGRRG